MKPGQDVHHLAPPTRRIDQMRFIYLMATCKCFKVLDRHMLRLLCLECVFLIIKM